MTKGRGADRLWGDMTTQELVNMDPWAFGAAVNELDAGTCSRCARDLFHRLGAAATFEEYLADVLAALVSSRGSGENQLVEAYQVAKKYLPDVAGGYGILGRLTALTVRVVALRLPASGGR